MSTIIFTNDFLFTSLECFTTFLFDILSPVIKNAADAEIVNLQDLDNNGEIFDRLKFFELSGINNVSCHHYLYDVSKIKDESWNYFFKFVPENSMFIGFELGLDLRKKLTEANIPYINFWVHSFKLFDDVPFMINTNNRNIWEKLNNYKIPKVQFDIYSKYWITYVRTNHKFFDRDLCDNSVVFIGQTLADKSIEKDGKFLNILDFKTRIEQFSKEYNTIYYVPHPSQSDNEEINEYINSTNYIKKIINIPTYFLLMSKKIKKVIAISSSVLFEAKNLGKEIEYLYQPLFDIDGEFGFNSFISVINDYYNPSFWSDILSPILNTNKDVVNKILFTDTKNKIRYLKNLYYGYMHLDELQILKNQISSLKLKENNIEVRDKFIHKLFSVKNKYSDNIKHKIITIFGIKMKFKICSL